MDTFLLLCNLCWQWRCRTACPVTSGFSALVIIGLKGCSGTHKKRWGTALLAAPAWYAQHSTRNEESALKPSLILTPFKKGSKACCSPHALPCLWKHSVLYRHRASWSTGAQGWYSLEFQLRTDACLESWMGEIALLLAVVCLVRGEQLYSKYKQGCSLSKSAEAFLYDVTWSLEPKFKTNVLHCRNSVFVINWGYIWTIY